MMIVEKLTRERNSLKHQIDVQQEKLAGLQRERKQFKIENLRKANTIKILQHQLNLVNELNVIALPLDGGTKFLDMNDDCVFYIFKKLDVKSLINLYGTSNKEVNRLMREFFDQELHIKYAANFNSSIHFTEVQSNTNLFVKYLMVFGHEIYSLQLNSESFDNFDWYEVRNIFDIIDAHVPNIRVLKLQNFYMRNLSGSFLRQLEELTLIDCSVTRQWDSMENLQTLRLIRCIYRPWPKRRIGGNADFDPWGFDYIHQTAPFPTYCFRRLVHVIIDDVNINERSLAHLIQRNNFI